jgi:hypothetical protein
MITRQAFERQNDHNFFSRTITLGDDGAGIRNYYVTVEPARYAKPPDGPTSFPKAATYTFADLKDAHGCVEQHVKDSLAVGYMIVS